MFEYQNKYLASASEKVTHLSETKASKMSVDKTNKQTNKENKKQNPQKYLLLFYPCHPGICGICALNVT